MKKVIVSHVNSDAFKDAYVSDFTAGVSIRETYKMLIRNYNHYNYYTIYNTSQVPPITIWRTTTMR